MNNKILKFIRLYHTVKYLKASQIICRVERRFSKTVLKSIPTISTRKNLFDFLSFPLIKSTYLLNDQFKFLNHIASIGSWNSPTEEKLWLYNLHYFDDLNALGFEDRLTQHHLLVNKWINENPPPSGNGWEPYPISLRIVNWIKFFLRENSVSKIWTKSLWQQAHVLEQELEYHLLGNHLFANAKALVFAGCFFEGDEAKNWLAKGLSILDKEIPEQILIDGGNFELSPMYHQTILADMLDLINLANCYQHPKLMERVESWKNISSRMLAWMQAMNHPDSEVSFFNDSAIGIAPTKNKLCEYAEILGIEAMPLSPSLAVDNLQVTYLSGSGYTIVENQCFKAILDTAKIGPDYIPGHAHADTLSFELSVFGQRVFVNSGTGEYGISDERLRQRKTAAHNTVEVDDQDSSEVWSGFRVARRAYPSVPDIFESDGNIKVSCSHNGYLRLPGKVTHNRDWSFTSSSISIKDILMGTYKSAIAHYHIHPDIQVLVNGQNATLTLSCGLQLTVEASQNIILEDTTWHPEFGLSIPNKKLLIPLKDNALDVTIRF
ncbi:heparinase II/III family protein [Vibrio fluvialis]|nr:heparinase II/III family protein [Vibrio fluvialis]